MVTPDEFQEQLQQAVSNAVELVLSELDGAITREQAGAILGKSKSTIRRMEGRNELTRLAPSGHPTYSRREVMKLRKSLYK